VAAAVTEAGEPHLVPGSRRVRLLDRRDRFIGEGPSR
jgi:hypothetical protein